jgi:hypothetical protein
MNIKPRLHILSAALLFVLVLSLAGQAVFASTGLFNISVYHGINGTSLGLSKDLPVDITIEKDGEILAVIDGFKFKDNLATQLPAGTYLITVSSQEAGPLPSMTVGPVEIPEGAWVEMHARLGANKTPIIDVKVR